MAICTLAIEEGESGLSVEIRCNNWLVATLHLDDAGVQLLIEALAIGFAKRGNRTLIIDTTDRFGELKPKEWNKAI